jgi:hypothetical protein
MMKTQLIDDDFAESWFEGDILFFVFKKNKIDLESAKKSVEIRTEITSGVSYPMYIDISEIKSVSKEARDYLAGGKAIEHISASALLAGSLRSKMLGTFYLSFNNPGIPVKLFTDKADALKWLRKFVNN